MFGISREENQELRESLCNLKIKLVLTRHEQFSGFMAATCGRLNGNTGVSFSTPGLGATNQLTASTYAYLVGKLMTIITGEKSIKEFEQSRFQIIYEFGVMAPIIEYTHQFESADNIPARMHEVFRLAGEEKPRVAHSELPEDICAERTDTLQIPLSLDCRPLAKHKAIEAAVEICITP